MRVNVIGIQKFDYESRKTGKHVVGTKLFYTFENSKVNGLECADAYISGVLDFPDPPCFADVYFNKFGGVDIINPV